MDPVQLTGPPHREIAAGLHRQGRWTDAIRSLSPAIRGPWPRYPAAIRPSPRRSSRFRHLLVEIQAKSAMPRPTPTNCRLGTAQLRACSRTCHSLVRVRRPPAPRQPPLPHPAGLRPHTYSATRPTRCAKHQIGLAPNHIARKRHDLGRFSLTAQRGAEINQCRLHVRMAFRQTATENLQRLAVTRFGFKQLSLSLQCSADIASRKPSPDA